MHPTSLANMQAFADAYLAPLRAQPLEILDVGAQAVDAHASYRPLFTRAPWRYRGLDMVAGVNVDIVVADPYDWRELADHSVDVVVSGQALEHIEFPWQTVAQIARVLRPGGLACLVAPSAGPEHRYPGDCWRIYPDGMAALAKAAGLNVVEVFTDWGLMPWQDSFAVLQKPAAAEAGAALAVPPVLPVQPNRRAGYAAYRAALPSRPKVPAYYATLAQLQHADGEADAARTTLRIGLEACASAPELRHTLVQRLLEAAQTDAALEHALVLLGSRPLSPASIDAIAAVAVQLDAKGAALLAALLPTERSALLRVAGLASAREHWALAALAWPHVCALQPAPPEAAVQLAQALRGSGQAAAASAAFAAARRAQLVRGDINRTTVVQRLIDARGARAYLEIGVERGSHFLQIDAAVKMAVDPRFKLPGGCRNTEHETYFETPSDAFFANPPALLREHGIDVALVDGLHTHAQALRDIENCLRHLNPGGIVVVHDCLPATAAEAMASHAEARRAPGFTGDWTGDVYRAIVELRARRPDLLVAVLDTDHGVGLVQPGAAESMLTLLPAEVAALPYDALSAGRSELLNLKPARWFDEWLANGAAGMSTSAAPGSDPYDCALPSAALGAVQGGVMQTRYRGMRLYKSPFDMALYLQLLQRLQPRTVIEIGTLDGGSAVWLADQTAALGQPAQVVSVDLKSRPLLADARVRFLEGDALQLDKVLTEELLAGLPHPWLVIEDSAHTAEVSGAVLRFFDRHLAPGDYIVIEDGVLRHLPGEVYLRYQDGPSRALAAFLAERGAAYEVDRALCDFYGRNVTYNPGGYLRRSA